MESAPSWVSNKTMQHQSLQSKKSDTCRQLAMPASLGHVCCYFILKTGYDASLQSLVAVWQMRQYLLNLKKKLPSMSPTSEDWPVPPKRFHTTSEELRRIYHRWRVSGQSSPVVNRDHHKGWAVSFVTAPRTRAQSASVREREKTKFVCERAECVYTCRHVG